MPRRWRWPWRASPGSPFFRAMYRRSAPPWWIRCARCDGSEPPPCLRSFAFRRKMACMRKVTVIVLAVAALASAQSDPHKMTKADVDRLMTELSNWGRWGKDDQLGTLNLITPAKRKQALALVKEGYPISLS